nr:unnamed protein product [Digitaria exilis]
MEQPLASSKDAHNPKSGGSEQAWREPCRDAAPRRFEQGGNPVPWLRGLQGGSVVVLYASIYGDVPMVVNLSGRFYLEKGVEERLGKEFMDRINKEGYIDVLNKSGKVLYRVTKDSLMERLNTDMHPASLSISKECRFFTIHGSADKIIPVEDAYEFAKLIPNHKLHIIKKANHGYTSHRKQLCDAVINSIISNEAGNIPS